MTYIQRREKLAADLTRDDIVAVGGYYTSRPANAPESTTRQWYDVTFAKVEGVIRADDFKNLNNRTLLLDEMGKGLANLAPKRPGMVVVVVVAPDSPDDYIERCYFHVSEYQPFTVLVHEED